MHDNDTQNTHIMEIYCHGFNSLTAYITEMVREESMVQECVPGTQERHTTPCDCPYISFSEGDGNRGPKH